MPTAQPQPAQSTPVPMPNGKITPTTLIDILVANGSLNTKSAEELKLAQVQTGKNEEELLRERNIVTENALARAKAALYKVDFIVASEIPASPEALALLPQEVANQFSVLPISVDKVASVLKLAMANPLDLPAIEFVEQKTGLKVIPFATNPNELKNVISERYAVSLPSEVSEAVKEAVPETGVYDIKTLGQVIREAPIAKIVSNILEFAVKSRASDVHIEAEEKRSRVRYRIDGILHEKLTLPHQVHDSLVSRIKILAGMKIDESRIPQDGRFSFRTGSEEVDLRVSTLPTVHGEKVVMRLLKKTGGVPDLPELGLRGRALKNLEDAIIRPHGIILVCGPTGSGKTTTLYSVLSRINTPKVNIITLEDPIEYQISGINQVQVNVDAGLTFASGLRSFLRQDPNIIMVGEIRDRETADLAIQASLTGHLVFSTLHTNDSAGALPRLLDMGAEPFLLASSITAILAQRVVRRIHEDCKETYKPEAALETDIKTVLEKLLPEGKEMNLYKGKGDEECANSGYLGRVGVFEVMPITEKIGRLILERSPALEIQKQAVSEGMITMKQDGYLKATEGVTSIEEVLRVAQE
ncbi:Flp pilus assembly complex ATPase component TadA [Candidatus Microgenomates bacterium]|nr:Flp pilus assembly complex ATPase component TadA [Candidatus Microgenomates bacterium]